MYPVTVHYMNDCVNLVKSAKGNCSKWVVMYDEPETDPCTKDEKSAIKNSKESNLSKNHGQTKDSATEKKSSFIPNTCTDLFPTPHCNPEFIADFVAILVNNGLRHNLAQNACVGQSVLVFLPGIFAIESVHRLLRKQIYESSKTNLVTVIC